MYNSEDTICRCIESILKQSYKNFEIIIVDDGSVDNSFKLVNSKYSKNKKIKIIQQVNMGQSSARNRAIRNSKGDLFAFVDSDDWIPERLFEKVVNLFNNNDVDIVDFKVKKVKDQREVSSNDGFTYKTIEGGIPALIDYLDTAQKEATPFSVCRKIYRKEIWEDLRFPEGQINEELSLNFSLLKRATSIAKTDFIGYYYFQTNNSTTRNEYMDKDSALLLESEKMLEKSKALGDSTLVELAKIKKARSYFSLLSKIMIYGYGADNLRKQDEVVAEYKKELRKNIKILMFSNISFNRKILIILTAISPRFLKIIKFIISICQLDGNIKRRRTKNEK